MFWISILGKPHIPCGSPICQSPHFFMFGSKLFGKDHFKFNRCRQSDPLVGFHFNDYITRLLNLFLADRRIYFKFYRFRSIMVAL